MIKTLYKSTLIIFLVGLCIAILPAFSFAAKEKPAHPQKTSSSDNKISADRRPIEVNGDRVEFFAESNKVTAEGNVVIKYQDTRLTCKKVTVYTQTKEAFAEGDAHLYSSKGEISGENLTYNFDKQTGMLYDAKLTAIPFYGAGKSIQKINANEMLANQAYITTCDLEKPHYRLRSKQVQIFPGNKVVAKNVSMVIGDTPIFYIPKYVQVLNDKRPWVAVTPGYDKKWGMYLLQAWRYYFDENAKGVIHLDYREKKDFASGFDYSYKMVNFGEGIIRTYYMNERSIQSKRIWDEPRNTVVKERFKGEWRHKWQIAPQTQAIWQYYKLKDREFLKDYFKREYEKVPDPKSFFLLTHTLPSATLSFDVEKRVNNFFATTEKLPEIKLDTIDQKIGESRFYFKNLTSFAQLDSKTAQPAATDPKGKKTERLDSYNQFSHQEKIGFIETRPYIAMRQTYFSRDNGPDSTNLVRGIFYSGVDLSTKFYRLFDAQTNFANLGINKLRHVITPSVSYAYIHPPTIPYSKLTAFDEVDTIDRKNQVTLSLENKLQTKRDGGSVDLLRWFLTDDYVTKNKSARGRFQLLKSDLEIKPYNWLYFSTDSEYNTKADKFRAVNFDFSAAGGDHWNIGLGQRYQRDILNQTTLGRQTTAEMAYRLNPKWKVRAYERFEAKGHSLKEQEYTIYRDLHCWTMEVTFNSTRREGNSIWIIFRIKAFPKMGFEFNNSYHQRKAGSQSTTEE